MWIKYIRESSKRPYESVITEAELFHLYIPFKTASIMDWGLSKQGSSLMYGEFSGKNKGEHPFFHSCVHSLYIYWHTEVKKPTKS